MSIDEIIDQYVICRSNCSLQYLEALAMNGFARRAYIEDCDRKNFKKIVLELINGDRIDSICDYEEEVIQSLRIINVYIGYSRRLKAHEQLEVIESKGEEIVDG